MSFNPSTTALVLVEMQNQWTQPGLYHRFLKREMSRLDSMDNAVRLADAMRDVGATVIHAPLVIDPQAKRGVFAHLSRGLVFRKGSSKSEIDTRVWHESDLVAHGRTAFDAFVGSDLEDLLRKTGTKDAVFAGFATDQCVAKTARTALKHGVRSWVASDACATFAPFLQRRVERAFGEQALSSSEIIERILPAAAAAE